jgi:TolA-binding protein
MKNRNSIGKFAPLFIVATLLISCATAPDAGKTAEPSVPAMARLPLNEQERLSQEMFEMILELTANEERASIIPRMEAMYREIIDKYPDAPLAQESYWRLIIMSIEDKNPPDIERAEAVYREFNAKYPGSPVKAAIDDTLMHFYYSIEKWDYLINILKPYIREYIKTGMLNGPYTLFLYSEAKLNLGDTVEAEKGYKIIIDTFPKSTEARISKLRLEKTQKKK